ncbi:hypothetical protein PAXRUDRAFT_179356, partial [Paxillus rubicundulus Ve08.2h10]
LECKMTAMSFFSKLLRLTPKGTFDHYRELMQITRPWWYLALLQRSGIGHDGLNSLYFVMGKQSLFCPACPQPGVNLPDDWEQVYPKWLVKLPYVVDGNFSAQHMKMKIPEDDISLSDGLAYMVDSSAYTDHISRMVEAKDRFTCQNHRAINAANASRKFLRVTGIGATACARHGCFVPHSVVDFQNGEWFMNINYSICQALNHQSKGVHSAILAYDAACQWQIHFMKRVQDNIHLQVPEGMDIVAAVGKFHLSSHKLECYPQFSLNFMEGAGLMDGEIIETLWAPLNKIAPSAQAMSAAHREELYDDHILEENWKKMTAIG